MKWLVEKVFEKKVFIYLFLFLVFLIGVLAYKSLKIDVFPDPSPVLVQIFTEAEGMAPEEVEKFVSYPIETSLYGLPHIEKITSLSTFGLSTVNVYFNDQIDIYFARQLVAQELPAVYGKLPEFVESPALGPITTGLGMIYIYSIESDLPTIELRTLQDWVIKFQLQSIPGIADVMSHGGEVKQFHVIVDPQKLLKYKFNLHTIIKKIQNASRNITAGYIVRNEEEYIIRGLGLFDSVASLRKVVVKESDSIPVFLENIAEVVTGPAIKRGGASLNDKDSVVSGIVMKLIGINTAELIKKIDKKLIEINSFLPSGIKLVPVYNQALIIKAAFRTISEALIMGIILVAFILFLFINDLKSALVSTIVIPFAVFITFIIMKFFDMTADLMSFGGLAIGIGLLVDATIVVVENIHRNRMNKEKEGNDKAIVLQSIKEVIKPLIYAVLIIIASFLPILTLSGIEGKMFRPFGFTLLVAVVAAIGYAVFISPVLVHSSGVKKSKMIFKGVIFEFIRNLYLKIFDISFPRGKLVMVIFLLVFLLSLVVIFSIGSEFIPRLNEQTIQLEEVLPQNTPLNETEKIVFMINQFILEFNEVKSVYSRIGRGEAGTHPHPVNVGHSIITLKDRRYWKLANQNELIEKIEARIKASIPGILLNFTQPIKHNLDHLLTGIRSDLAIKIYGTNYFKLLREAEKVKNILATIQGVKDAQVSKISGLNEISIKLNRENLGRYGINAGDILEEIEAAIGGKIVAKVYQGDVPYDIFIRYAPEFRKNIIDINRYLIFSENSQMIPLSEVAEISEESGLSNIIRENGKRYIVVQCNARGRDIGSIVKEAKSKIHQILQLPLGYYLEWGGQYELKEKAEKKLALILLITLLVIMILLFDYLKSWKDMAIILVNLPISLSGGVLALWISGTHLSVPSTIGFLALLGIALENTLVLISFFKRKIPEYSSFDAAIRESVSQRLRPILMTKFTTIIGLFPLLLATGIGSEIQKPLAIVVIGGIFFSIFTTLFLMPAVYKKMHDIKS